MFVAVRSAFDALGVALFPPRCGGCDASLAARPAYGLCTPCFEVLEPNDGARCERCDLPASQDGRDACDCAAQAPGFSALRAPFVYGGPLADLIVAAKFRGREELCAALGRLLAEDRDVVAMLADADGIVPVPLGRKRARQRGYNQTAMIARRLGRNLEVPVQYALRRVRDTVPQSDLPLNRRRKNVAGAFAVRGSVSGRVVLVDDVVTSTETVRQAAAALRQGGASDVVVVAVARAVD